MNRVIKFRTWDIDKGEMVFLTSNSLKELMLNDCFEKLQKQFDIMQFTGLLDMYGKEIWEKDIVITGEGFEGIVEFVNGQYIVETFINGDEEALWEPKVVGNIYENI